MGQRARAMGRGHRQARGHRRQNRAHGRQHFCDGGDDLFAASLVDRDKHADVRLEAAMCKLWATEQAWEIVNDADADPRRARYETAASLAARGEAPVPSSVSCATAASTPFSKARARSCGCSSPAKPSTRI